MRDTYKTKRLERNWEDNNTLGKFKWNTVGLTKLITYCVEDK